MHPRQLQQHRHKRWRSQNYKDNYSIEKKEKMNWGSSYGVKDNFAKQRATWRTCRLDPPDSNLSTLSRLLQLETADNDQSMKQPTQGFGATFCHACIADLSLQSKMLGHISAQYWRKAAKAYAERNWHHRKLSPEKEGKQMIIETTLYLSW